MFKTLPAFSPTGNPKLLPATANNILKYELYLTSLQDYLTKSEEKGHFIDSSKRAKLNKLFGTASTENVSFNESTVLLNNRKKTVK